MQSRDREQVRQPRLRVAVAHGRVELGAARDHQRLDERRPRAEQPLDARHDPVPQGAAPAPHPIEQLHPPRDEHPARRVAGEAPRHHPRRAAPRRRPLRPAHPQPTTARRPPYNLDVYETAAVGRRIDEPHDRGAGIRIPHPASRIPAPFSSTCRAPLPHRSLTPEQSRDAHDPHCRPERRLPPEHERHSEHGHQNPRIPHPASRIPKNNEAGPQADPERDRKPHDRRFHPAASASYMSCTDFAPQRGASATRRNPSSSTTSSFAFS